MSVQRLSIPKASPEGYAALTAVETYIQRSGLPTSLVDLVKMRASQINGCAFCLDMHSKDARKLGGNGAAALSPQRLARVANLHAGRACCAGLDRVSDTDRRDSCTRC